VDAADLELKQRRREFRCMGELCEIVLSHPGPLDRILEEIVGEKQCPQLLSHGPERPRAAVRLTYRINAAP